MRIAGARPCLVFLVAYAPFLPVELAEQVSTPDVVKAPLPAVVLIKAITPSGDATGSGFLVDPSGTVVTNLHVIQGASAVAVKLSNGDVYDQVRVRAFDHRKDLVIVQLPAYGLPAIDLGDSDALQVGDPVILAGHLPVPSKARSRPASSSGFEPWQGGSTSYKPTPRQTREAAAAPCLTRRAGSWAFCPSGSVAQTT